MRYSGGFHNGGDGHTNPTPDPNLYMIHLHNADYEYCAMREKAKYTFSVSSARPDEPNMGMNGQNNKDWLQVVNSFGACGYAFINDAQPGIFDFRELIPIPPGVKVVNI